MKAIFSLLILMGMLCANSSAVTTHQLQCEARNNDCYHRCARTHPYNAHKRERCDHKCTAHYNACLVSPPPSVVIEPVPYPYPYTYPYYYGPYYGWHHRHRHWR